MAAQLSKLKKQFTSISSPIFSRFLSVNPLTHEPEPVISRHLYGNRTPLHALKFPETRITTLPNGIRVATQTAPVSATHTASVGVWIDAGSRYEAPGTNGTAHFLEHLIFKGTKRRTARSLEEEIENKGARLNAYTSREQTTFFADVQSKDVDFAVDVLADILQNSKFPERAIERERGVILREMQEVQGIMEEVIFDHLHEAAFKGQPLGDTILGPEEKIRSIDRQDLQRYITTHYSGHRMVVSVAGAVKHDEIVNLISRSFTNFSDDPTTADELVNACPAKFTGSEVRVNDEDNPVLHFAIAFEGKSWTDADSIPLMVLQCLLGSWNRSIGQLSGSKLARRVFKDNLAEGFMSFNTNYRDTGLFGIYAIALPGSVHKLSSTIMEELRRLASQVSAEEVTRAKNQLKSSLLLRIDGSTAVSENNGCQMLTYGRVIPFLELFARIDGVCEETIKEMARNVIINKDVAISAVGPVKELPSHSWFCSQTREL